jgi:hypothetical protein
MKADETGGTGDQDSHRVLARATPARQCAFIGALLLINTLFSFI